MNRSKSVHESSLLAFSSSANDWLSQVRFDLSEVRFMELLIEKYLKWLAEGVHADQVEDLSVHVKRCGQQALALESSIMNHLQRLATVASADQEPDDASLKRHIDLQNDLVGFSKSLHQVKTSIFELTEAVSRSEKVRSLDKLINSRS